MMSARQEAPSPDGVIEESRNFEPTCPVGKMMLGLLAKFRDRSAKLSRTEEKQLAIVEAAEKLFLDKGFGSTSMDDIAKEAGVSKRTVYAHFTSKELLFSSVMEMVCAKVTGSPPEAISEMHYHSPEQALTQIGEFFLNLILNPNAVALFRNVIAEAPAFPSLGETFYANDSKWLVQQMALLLAEYDRRGELSVPDPHRASEVYFGALKGGPIFRVLVLNKYPDDPSEVQHHIATTVSIMLSGLQPK
jgi:TetR/AcrR family transcriptional repressor of mexJK operon